MFKTDTGLFNKDYRNKAFKMYLPKQDSPYKVLDRVDN